LTLDCFLYSGGVARNIESVRFKVNIQRVRLNNSTSIPIIIKDCLGTRIKEDISSIFNNNVMDCKARFGKWEPARMRDKLIDTATNTNIKPVRAAAAPACAIKKLSQLIALLFIG
jgi:hypothetical protein